MMRDTRDYSIERLFRHTVDRWRARGMICEWHVRENLYGDAIELTLMLPNGRPMSYVMTHHEINMGQIGSVRDWLGTIEEELVRQYIEEERRNSWRVTQAPPSPSIRPMRAMRDIDLIDRERYLNEIITRGYPAGYFGMDLCPTPFSVKAETKSKALFITIAGQQEYQVLESGRPLPLKGSLGTDYELYKRATYCVERPRDGAKLCAVVPDVPLWDHLLGIKLMVEHDEPTFLRTANVSGGHRATFSLYESSRLVVNMNDATAISCTRRQIKEMADGTIRVSIDIDPRFKSDFHRLFPNIDTPVALAPLELDFEQVPGDHRVAVLNSDWKAKVEVEDKKPFGKEASELYRLGFFFNPKVLEAIGTDEEYIFWVQLQPSAYSGEFSEYVNGDGRCVAAHVRRAGESGTGYKAPYAVIPLTQEEHMRQHAEGESALVGAEWFDKMRAKYVQSWASKSLSIRLNYPSMGYVPPEIVRAWALAHDIDNVLPACYRQAFTSKQAD
jgi:hypothetical protein